ncbi:MAG: 4-vinyl reductase [Deltaproteobacteria bacterium]|nr:4-vinyl reductase [Deltaproteobacteria bacterium]MBW2128952.1 4-vinyl reductase [Deltaproteobacteria bacterium]MBW2302766.1 4-vinyl reductase [Deltaproteobacteria bacterium]
MNENTILKDLRHDAHEGSLRYKGVRYLLIRPETIVGFQKAIEGSTGEGQCEALYKGGFDGGYLSSKNYREIHGFTELEVLDFMARMGGEIGWGRFKIERYDPNTRALEVSVTASPFAEAYGESAHPVCHLIRGIVAGMGSALLGIKCDAVETACSAMGADRCLFNLIVGY